MDGHESRRVSAQPSASRTSERELTAKTPKRQKRRGLGSALNEYGWRFRSRAKVSIALSFFSFVCSALLAGTKSWTTGCLNRVSALCWRIGGGPSAGRNRQGRDRGRCLVSSVRNVENTFTASGQPLLALARSERPEEFWLLSLRLAVASDVVWGVARIVTPKCVQHPRKLSRDSNGRNELATPQLNIGGPQ